MRGVASPVAKPGGSKMRKSTIEPVGAITDRPRDLKQIAIVNSDLIIISCGNSTICKQIVYGRSMSASLNRSKNPRFHGENVVKSRRLPRQCAHWLAMTRFFDTFKGNCNAVPLKICRISGGDDGGGGGDRVRGDFPYRCGNAFLRIAPLRFPLPTWHGQCHVPAVLL